MIRIQDVTKYYDEVCAVHHVSFDIPDGTVFGLVGTNGAGKSTLLRMMAGVLACDSGSITYDGSSSYENPECKREVFYLPDTPYYFPNANIEEMVHFYRKQYPAMEKESVSYMAELFNLDMRLPLRIFSKGMKRQAFLILALCAGTKYLLCDEVFDGLDPVMTEAMKNLFRKEMEERKLTIVAGAHKLKDLEDICHNMGIMHKGGILKAGDMLERTGDVIRIQCVFDGKRDMEQELKKELSLIRYEREGYFTTLIVKGEKEEVLERIQKLNPVFAGELPMSLEEIFMAEMEEAGYDICKVLC